MKCEGIVLLTGLPCQRDVAHGFKRCYLHGGSTPGAKLQAERALTFARMPAIQALHQIIFDYQQTACPTCGRPGQQLELLNPVIRACQLILDRTGFGPKMTIETTKTEEQPLDITALTDEERNAMSGLIVSMRELKAKIRLRLRAAEDEPMPALRLMPGEDTAKRETRTSGLEAKDGQIVNE